MTYRLHTALFLTAISLPQYACWAQRPAVARPAERDYSLPAQPLPTMLAAIAQASGANILASSRVVEGKQAPALIGRYSVERALAIVLEGSGLAARATNSGLIVERRNAGADLAAPETQDAEASTIVVTGTRIRGAPVASPVIRISEDSIRNAGQASLGEVVRSIPQSFGGGQQPGIGLNVPAASGVDVGGGSSVNLRGLGSDATLTLLNGHRLAYSSSRQSVDVSAIPVSIVDRVEIVADGASAIYGSDAVAGVANIVLKRDFDGIEARARIGGSTDGGNFTQHYGLLGGTTWNEGGFALAYEFSRNSVIEAEDRSYARTRTPGLQLFPALKSHNLLFTGHQSLGDIVTVSVDALRGDRKELLEYAIDPSGDRDISRSVSSSRTRSFVAAPSLDAKIGNSWHATLTATLGEDRTRFRSEDFERDVSVFSIGGCYCNKSQSIELSGSGSLAALPAGDLKAAIGAGYRNNDFTLDFGAGNTQNITASQDSHYIYGEVNLPVVAPAQDVPRIDRLSLTGALRYERYPGIGEVATPKVGLIYAPNQVFEFKASWGQSFRAPTLRQQYQPLIVQLFRPSRVGGQGFPANSTVVYATGGNAALKPERATSWSATIVVHPEAWNGARLELSYFNTRYRDRVVTPVSRLSQALGDPIFRDFVTLAPDPAQATALVANAEAFFNGTGAPFDPAWVVAIVDSRNINAGRQRIEGVDLLIDYDWELGPARTITLGANASYLKSDQRNAAAQPTFNLAGTIFNPPHWRARGIASWRSAEFTLTGIVNYSGRVNDTRGVARTTLSDTLAVDLTARYRTGEGGPLGGLDLTLGVQNLLNDKPEAFEGDFFETPYDSTNSSPIGRYLSLSIAKKW